ncbi:MAG TPA: hypothetical protein VEA99_02020 [Gemmatimonadaceae bacterium]|nr:hypothetical protein [Gemmatimonadaceae bacterium]
MPELLVLRLLHVLGGIFWLGSGLFTSLFLMPSLATAGPAAGAVMASMQRRRLFVVLPLVATVTVLSGLRLLWIVSGGLDARYLASGSGRAFAASGATALVAFLLGMFVGRPAMSRAARLGGQLAGAREEAERASLQARVATLQRRGRRVNAIVTVLLTVGAAGMAVARYLQ